MRAEKKLLTSEYVSRLNGSPFFIVAGYQGLKVAHLNELRKRLTQAGAEIHVVKNTVFCVAAKEAGVTTGLDGALTGQVAVITGKKDIFVTAKVLKNFAAEFDKLKLKFGYLNNQRIENDVIMRICRASKCSGPSCSVCSVPRPRASHRSSRRNPKRRNKQFSFAQRGRINNNQKRKSSVRRPWTENCRGSGRRRDERKKY
jgi:large subunit ribosomal protein L10